MLSTNGLSTKGACIIFGVLALGMLLTSSSGPPEAREDEKPNIILIITDDLDARSASIAQMPNLTKYLVDHGITFENAFVTNPLCCPSRATVLRGQYSHNHGVLYNFPPLGGAQRFRDLGREESTAVTWLHNSGYRTVEIGKYLNGYTPPKPPGWDKWYGRSSPEGAYPTDHYANEAARYIRGMNGEQQPFFMWLAPHAPHAPARPPARYADRFPNVKAPRPPSFNEEDLSDKPAWIQAKPPLTNEQISDIDKLYRNRLRSMLAVDDLIGRIVDSLRYSRKLSNTYIFFMSDNGLALGEHRRKSAKSAPYEEDIRIPLMVRGPGVAEGVQRKHVVLNNDLAPTFAKLGGVAAPSFVDGRSFVPLLRSGPPLPSEWRTAFLVEGYASDRWTHPAYKAIRTTTHQWVEYTDGDRELYDLREDPYESQSRHRTAPADFEQRLASRLDRLRDCARDRCLEAEGF